MLFWHVGFSIFIFRYVYKDYEADLRYLAGGALLPDFVDFLFNLFGLRIAFNQPGHTLISVSYTHLTLPTKRIV